MFKASMFKSVVTYIAHIHMMKVSHYIFKHTHISVIHYVLCDRCFVHVLFTWFHFDPLNILPQEALSLFYR